jgi:hypothetical protein
MRTPLRPYACYKLVAFPGLDMSSTQSPPPLAQPFAKERDEAITTTFATIQQSPPGVDSTHTLPIGA